LYQNHICSYLLGQDSFNDIIYHTQYDNLDMIPVGAVSNERISIGYCRVSAKHQKDDLERQINLIEPSNKK